MIRICIEVKSRIRIRIKRVWIRNTVKDCSAMMIFIVTLVFLRRVGGVGIGPPAAESRRPVLPL
jgi:hypothetical protein